MRGSKGYKRVLKRDIRRKTKAFKGILTPTDIFNLATIGDKRRKKA